MAPCCPHSLTPSPDVYPMRTTIKMRTVRRRRRPRQPRLPHDTEASPLPYLNNMQPHRRRHLLSHPPLTTRQSQPSTTTRSRQLPVSRPRPRSRLARHGQTPSSLVSLLTLWASAHSLTRINQVSRAAADISYDVTSILETPARAGGRRRRQQISSPRPTSAHQSPTRVPNANSPLARLRRFSHITLRLSPPVAEILLGFGRGDVHNARTRPSASKIP